MATKPKAEQAEVNQLGDVTERTPAVIDMGLLPVHLMSELPEDHKGLAVSYPSAKGFTFEGSSIALHF